jgi:N-acetylglucosamine malate deacetylase 1
MPSEPLRLLILGAHPDDAEYYAGGLASIYRKLGHEVRMISLTNGDAGHHARSRRELADIRRHEAEASAKSIGATSGVWDHHDGELQPTLKLRERVIAEIRRFQPDLVLTHRANDYHPDHRAVGQVVQDASFMVRVPLVVPDVPALHHDPVVAFMTDMFTKPCPMSGDVILDVEDQIDSILGMLSCHQSQVFEWLPWLDGVLDQVPTEHEQRMTWLREWYRKECRPRVERYRNALIAAYGPDRGQRVEFTEVFEISEYGSPLDAAARKRLFGFSPSSPK